MVSIVTDIPDPIYDRMGLGKYKNCYGNLISEVDELVMYGSQVSWAMASSICLVTIPILSTPCGVYSIENNTTFSIAKKEYRNEYWGFNPYYGWNMLTHDMLQNILKNRLGEARKT